MNAHTFAKQVHNIFSLPEIVIGINEILNEPEPNIPQLEELLIHDPALTAKLLKFVNSSYFGLRQEVSTVSRAISMLGFIELKHLVMGVSVTAQFNDIPADLVDMTTFWYHSIFKGVLAKELAKQLGYKNYERFYITGLLSSLGQLILFSRFPVEMKEILAQEPLNEETMLNAELQAFGFAYPELGAELFKLWRLPDEIWQTVMYQFDPLNENAPQRDACIMHIASKISGTLQPCHNQTYDFDSRKPDFQPGVLECLQLTEEDLKAATSEALIYPLEILNIIFPGAMMIF